RKRHWLHQARTGPDEWLTAVYREMLNPIFTPEFSGRACHFRTQALVKDTENPAFHRRAGMRSCSFAAVSGASSA
ncbi:hypothetical protein SB724_21760, partial [Bacillus sp. SIMBA_031]|uniref:hypothetical protein n=1 Tax=Bacillus sp. SIMBA_031 TaxID=3085774 RepID=UPI00397D51B7